MAVARKKATSVKTMTPLVATLKRAEAKTPTRTLVTPSSIAVIEVSLKFMPNWSAVSPGMTRSAHNTRTS